MLVLTARFGVLSEKTIESVVALFNDKARVQVEIVSGDVPVFFHGQIVGMTSDRPFTMTVRLLDVSAMQFVRDVATLLCADPALHDLQFCPRPQP